MLDYFFRLPDFAPQGIVRCAKHFTNTTGCGRNNSLIRKANKNETNKLGKFDLYYLRTRI